MFGLVSGKLLLNQRFESAETAREWGEWNSKGKATYQVVEIQPGERFIGIGKAGFATRKKSEPICNCEGKTKIWSCPVHGNMWDGT